MAHDGEKQVGNGRRARFAERGKLIAIDAIEEQDATAEALTFRERPERARGLQMFGKGQQFDVAPGQENADVSRREWFGRYIDLYRDGRLKGGLLAQMPQEQLGEPLPGTAPPPGTNVPPGLVQFLPEPVDPAAPPPPAPPPVS